MSDAGLGPTGFTPLSLSESSDDLTAKLQTAFGGTTVDVSSQSYWGQLIGIMANANADLWAAMQAIYANTYPAGASGVGVDNILAINNLKRLPAKATVTNPIAAVDLNGFTKYGFVVYGTPGTVVPAGTLVSNGASSPVTFAIDAALTIGASANAVQTLYFSNAPTSGAYALSLTAPNSETLTTADIPYNAQANVSTLSWNDPPTSSSFTLTVGSETTPSIIVSPSSPLTATLIQNALASLQGYSAVTVSGTASSGFSVAWNSASAAQLGASGEYPPDTIVQSVSSFVCPLIDAQQNLLFSDVQLFGGSQNIQFTFGGNSPVSGAASTAAQPIQPIVVAHSSLAAGSSITSLSVQTKAQGNAAQAIGSATCTQLGAIDILAGQLNTIVNPVSGFSGCTNQLDCLTGQDLESDSEAITRLAAQQGSASSGSLTALITKVRAVAGVTQVVGTQNVGNAAQQVIVFGATPTQGSYALQVGGQTTGLLPYNAVASDLQAALTGLSGLSGVQVSTYGVEGFTIDFGGTSGRQSQPLLQVATNTTTVSITPYFGRSPHSVELVVQGGSDSNIANTILAALPAGIATYSNPDARTLASTTAGSSTVTVQNASNIETGQSVEGSGILAGTTVSQVTGKQILLSNQVTATASNVPLSFDHAVLLTDAAGNPVEIGFSRPVTTLIYITLNLVTDMYLTPGDNTSGLNPASKFNLDSVAAIAQELIATVNATEIGGTIIANGSNSLGGSFRSTPGIESYALFFDRVSPPVNQNNLKLANNEAPLAESFNCQISYQ